VSGVTAGAAEAGLQAAGAAAGTAAGAAAGVATSFSKYSTAAKETALAKAEGPLGALLSLWIAARGLVAALLGAAYASSSYVAGAGVGATQSALEMLADRSAFQSGHQAGGGALRRAPSAAKEAAAAGAARAERAAQGAAAAGEELGARTAGAIEGLAPGGPPGAGEPADLSLGYGRGLCLNLGAVRPAGPAHLPPVVEEAVERARDAAGSGRAALAGAARRAQRVTAEALAPARQSFVARYEATKRTTEGKVDIAVDSECPSY
jgi:hypothetical protein